MNIVEIWQIWGKTGNICGRGVRKRNTDSDFPPPLYLGGK